MILFTTKFIDKVFNLGPSVTLNMVFDSLFLFFFFLFSSFLLFNHLITPPPPSHTIETRVKWCVAFLIGLCMALVAFVVDRLVNLLKVCHSFVILLVVSFPISLFLTLFKNKNKQNNIVWEGRDRCFCFKLL